MHLENQRTFYKWFLYKTLILLVHFLFAKSWEVSGCGHAKVELGQARIVGGNSVNIVDVPWQVYLLMDGNYQCGGSIIQPRWILTAAHCVIKNKVERKVNVFAGVSTVTEIRRRLAQRPKVKRVIIHEEYDEINIVSDIALVELESPLKFNVKVGAICQLKENERLPSTGIATGWGLTVEDSSLTNSDALQMVEVTLYSDIGCLLVYRVVIESILCAGRDILFDYERKGTCSGDSGGPLVVPVMRGGSYVWVLLGVTSSGHKLGCGVVPDMYSRVTSFEKWIDCKISNCDNSTEKYDVPSTFSDHSDASPSILLTSDSKQYGGMLRARHLVLIATNLAGFVLRCRYYQ